MAQWTRSLHRISSSQNCSIQVYSTIVSLVAFSYANYKWTFCARRAFPSVYKLMTSEYLQYMNLQSLGLLVTIAGMVIIRKSTSSILSLYKSPVRNFMYIQLSLCFSENENRSVKRTHE